MNLLFLTLLYPPKTLEQVSRDSKDGLQNQINSYQWAFVEGLRQNLGEGESLSILNSLPVGTFPGRYRKLLLPSWREKGFSELGSLNLPFFKQRARSRKAARAIVAWAKESPANRQVLLYSLYLPYMQAVAKAKKRFGDLKATVIVTDLPNELGISSGRRGMMKRLEYAMGDQRIQLCSAFDGFVLLTEPMAQALPIQGKPRMVIEGLILPRPQEGAGERAQEKGNPPESRGGKPSEAPGESSPLPVVLYTGTLNRELGIGELLEAFTELPHCQLWLCGRGDMEEKARQAAQAFSNIRYFGFVSQGEALALQARADILVNPRSGKGVFTRYSFPSKTLEYMRSGKPVLSYPLEGIPREYDPYLVYIRGEGAGGIREAVQGLLAMPRAQRENLGQAAQAYVLARKNPKVQCQKLLGFLRGLSG
ncbi:MAG: glycosyltransferase [Candidatus Limiplasma sp.]|nr:glycosyltransferase [Candidatus Limiplasma sp.]